MGATKSKRSMGACEICARAQCACGPYGAYGALPTKLTTINNNNRFILHQRDSNANRQQQPTSTNNQLLDHMEGFTRNTHISLRPSRDMCALEQLQAHLQSHYLKEATSNKKQESHIKLGGYVHDQLSKQQQLSLTNNNRRKGAAPGDSIDGHRHNNCPHHQKQQQQQQQQQQRHPTSLTNPANHQQHNQIHSDHHYDHYGHHPNNKQSNNQSECVIEQRANNNQGALICPNCFITLTYIRLWHCSTPLCTEYQVTNSGEKPVSQLSSNAIAHNKHHETHQHHSFSQRANCSCNCNPNSNSNSNHNHNHNHLTKQHQTTTTTPIASLTSEQHTGNLVNFIQPILEHHHHHHHHHQQQQQQQQQQRRTAIAPMNTKPAAMNCSSISQKEEAACCDRGMGLVKDGQHKGLAYTHDERKKLAILGLIPPAYQSQDLQVEVVMNFIGTIGDELSKYIYLRHLKDYNERLFYKTLTQNVEKLMPIVYTPIVGLACQKFSHIYMRPRGLYITIDDLTCVDQILANWPEKEVKAIVVTDGERILGLGDLGSNGMGISIGKLSLYTALAGIPPKSVLPITIDVGTNNTSLLKDPFYTGLRQQRVRGAKYDQLLEEFMLAVVSRFGRSCLIQFEDFANATAFDLLQRYRSRYCTFNDDIQGTASVCLSGLFSAAKITNTRMGDHTYLFYGAGEANLGTAQLLVMAMIEYGVKEAEAKKKIWLVDSRGLVVRGREGPQLSGHKARFVQEGPPLKGLEEIIDFVKPTALIGASAQGASFTESICSKMAKLNERPIIFALSNPTSKAECTAEQAYNWTQGRCVFASGSPFDPVQYQGKTYITGQGNNSYIFPGVGLAVIAARVHTIPEETFLVAAKALSDQLTDTDIEVGLVYPRLSKIREVTLKVAARVFHYFYAERLANHRPEPQDKLSYLRNIQYDYDYDTTPSLAKLTLDGATKTHNDQQINKNGASLFTGAK